MSQETLVGIQGELGGSFHEEAARIVYGDKPDVRYVPYGYHDKLLEALFRGQVHDVVSAVDNNTSGRVTTSIDAINNHTNVRVIGSVTMPIRQHLLLYPGDTVDDLDSVMSQQPALDQCYDNLRRLGLQAHPASDTVWSARHVNERHGRNSPYIHTGSRFGAIASALAGKTHGLIVGPALQDNPNNATKFWVITDRQVERTGTHTAMTFEVPDKAGELCRAIGIISVEYGLNLTDIDTHLKPHNPRSQAFFAELECSDPDKIKAAMERLSNEGFEPHVIGEYTPINRLEVANTNQHIPRILQLQLWNAYQRDDRPDTAEALYIETDHRPGALYAVLACLSACNLLDVSRPTVPKDHDFNRGFYITIDPLTDKKVSQAAIEALAQHDYTVESVDCEAMQRIA